MQKIENDTSTVSDTEIDTEKESGRKLKLLDTFAIKKREEKTVNPINLFYVLLMSFCESFNAFIITSLIHGRDSRLFQNIEAVAGQNDILYWTMKIILLVTFIYSQIQLLKLMMFN